jgi:hypothetical protein
MNSTPRKINSNLAISLYFLIKLAHVLVSGITIYLGYELFVLGVTGRASLSVETRSVSGQLLNAAPGLFFALGGIIALICSIWKGVKVEWQRLNDYLTLGIVSSEETGVEAGAKDEKP